MSDRKMKYALIICMLTAILSRIVFLADYPGGIGADEAFAGYEAFSIANYGIDSWGYSYPVYFTTWGSGMSALSSYMMAPFIKMFGLSTLTIRLPQMLMGILTVFVLYLLLRHTSDEKTALLGTFLLAVSPWHIMTSRYGMDANMAPALILLGVYFGVRGFEKGKYFILSALFWGLSLYTYAAIWIFVPVFLFLTLIYCFCTRKLKFSRWLILSFLLLFVLALPLLLFVAVNLEYIDEIVTPFLSIPRLVEFRGDEVSLRALPSNIILAIKIFFSQNDYNIWNSIPYFGIYYLFSTPFVVAGGVVAVVNAVKGFKEKRFTYDFVLIIWVFTAAMIAVLQRTNLNRSNDILLALFILLAKGLVWFCGKVKHHAMSVTVVVYVLCFVIFEGYYFTVYQDIISRRQLAGADEALAFASKLYETDDYDYIYVTGELRQSQVLLYTQYPTEDYVYEVEWKNYPSKYLVAERFGNYYWYEEDDEKDEYGIYVIKSDETADYRQQGYSIKEFDYCAVAYMEEM